jgi:signal transduction histidine kinase
MRKRLYARIYLHFLGVLVVVGIASSIVFATGWRVDFLRNWTVRLAAHSAHVVGRQADTAARIATVKHISDELGMDVTLRDLDGRIVASTGAEMPALSAEDMQHVIADGASLLPHRRHWLAVAPVRDSTRQVIGFLETTPMHRFAPWSVLRPLLMVAVVLLVVGIATFPLARRISRPVERLTEASRRFGAGDLSYRVPLHWLERRNARWRDRKNGRRAHRHHPELDELVDLSRAWNEMAERIEKLVRGQRELLANVSHELRSPLARIRVALELLPDDAATEARRRDLAGDLGELEQLIDDVLTTSRLDATGLPVHIERVSVGDLLGQLAERAAHDPLTTGKPVRVDADGVGEIDADQALLKRALWNLVENAAKYGTPPIVLDAARDGERVRLSVTDEGAGIPPEDREHVFDPFYRRDKARTPGASSEARSGYGLGLTLARRVAEVHGGSIRIDATRPDGQGCKITLELPLTTSAAASGTSAGARSRA